MNINDIMRRDMEDARKRAEIERKEKEFRAIRRCDKIVNFGCALLTVLAIATIGLLAFICSCDRMHGRAVAHNATNSPSHAVTNNTAK